jgi:3-mercaptopyruvate sulfurtransferase SseA
MTVEVDPSASFTAFAHPGRLVSTDWLRANLGAPGLVVVESDEDVLLYETGHIPGAVKVDWHTDLNDPVQRDYIDGARFAALVGSKGISRDTTVVIYGDKNNWWAAYALWVFTLFGHDDVRLLDGGRAKWEAEGGEYVTPTSRPAAVDYPVVEPQESSIPAVKVCSRTSANRSSTCVPPRSTAANAPQRPPTPRKDRFAPVTSRAHRACRGVRPWLRMARSEPSRNSNPFIGLTLASPPATM